jgi:hypothetical protein
MAISSLAAIASAMSCRTSAPSTHSITLKEMLDLLHRNQNIWATLEASGANSDQVFSTHWVELTAPLIARSSSFLRCPSLSKID